MQNESILHEIVPIFKLNVALHEATREPKEAQLLVESCNTLETEKSMFPKATQEEKKQIN